MCSEMNLALNIISLAIKVRGSWTINGNKIAVNVDPFANTFAFCGQPFHTVKWD